MSKPQDIPAPFDMLPQAGIVERRLPRGGTLFRQGDPAGALFFVRDGEVSLVRHTEAGRKVPVFRATAGDTLAEASLFSEAYHCDGVAETDSQLLGFGKRAVLQAMSQDPAFALALLRRMAGQVQTYRRKLELLSIPSAKERVLAGLSDGWLKESVIAFAADLGLTHEATYRALAELVKEGRARKPGRGRYVASAG